MLTTVLGVAVGALGVVGILILAVLLVVIVRVTLVRALLVRWRYDVHSFLGREPGDAIWLTYEEGRDKIDFFGDRDARIVTLPDDATWARIMPPWCATRRSDIVRPLRRHADRVRVTLRESAVGDGLAILWTERPPEGRPQVHRIDW